MRRINVVFRDEPHAVEQSAMQGAGRWAFAMNGAYGYVRKQQPKLGTVSVELMNGVVLHSVRVPSRSWVDETASTVTGTYDLPPVNSYVFVFFPYGRANTSGAVVLFSIFDDANKEQATRIVEGDKSKIVEVLSGGIKTTYDRETGNYLVEDLDDSKLKILVDKENGKIELFDWNDNKVTLDSSGVKLEAKGNTVLLENAHVLVNNNLEVLQ